MIEFLDEDSTFTSFEGVYFMLVASFGIPANLLSVVVLCGQRCGMSRSTVTYLVSLAVVDTLFLLLGGLVAVGFRWVLPEERHPLASTALCGVVNFSEGWTLCSSQWIVAAFTLERYLLFRGRCLGRPLLPRSRPRCRPSRPKVALLLVLVSVLGSQVLSLPFCWLYRAWPGGGEAEAGPTFTLMKENRTQATLSSQCKALSGPQEPAFLWLHAVLAGFLPMSLTLSFSILVFHHFRRRARILAAPDNAAPIRSTGSRMQRSGRIQATVALVTVLLSLPRYVIQGLGEGLGVGLSQHAVQWVGWDVAVGVATMMQWISLVIHFLLYCFLSSGFRRETLVLLRCFYQSLRKPANLWRRCFPSRPPQTLPCQVWLVQDVLQQRRTS
nr:probable G-protein coupled receptor 139 [Paramormyrops kingsleyae]